MSTPATHQDASLSAASFLASINAESSTAFGSDASTSAAATSSAPSLPISAKVALIDAQIDSLETRIEQTITTHAAELRERAASTRAVDRDLNQLWRSVNQTSSRLVTVGPQLAPIASDYHQALAQSSKQGLLISVLSDLLAATRQLETLEKLRRQPESSASRAQMAEAFKLMQPFRSSPALQHLPAVVELQARLDRLEKESAKPPPTTRNADTEHAVPSDQARAPAGVTNDEQQPAESTGTASQLSPALKVLEAARAIIVSRAPAAGWKEVRIELDAPAPPPPAMVVAAPPPAVAPSTNSNRPSIDTRPEHLLGEELYSGSASLTRNSSSSSATNARNRHKPKLGARVIRPQDQLGSGPFNAEDIPVDEDGWGLDEDDEDISAPPRAASNDNATQMSHPTSNAGQPIHQSVAALARDDGLGSSSSSVMMQSSMSSSSSQRSVFAVQEPESREKTSGSNDGDAWGLGEEENDAEADAWDLDDDDAPNQPPASPKKAFAPVQPSNDSVKSPVSPTTADEHDAWGLEDEDLDADEDPWETGVPQKQVVEPTTKTAMTSPTTESSEAPLETSADDPWETADQPEKGASSQLTSEAPLSFPILESQATPDSIPSSSATAVRAAVTSPTVRQELDSSTQAQSGASQVSPQALEQKVAHQRQSLPTHHVEPADQVARVTEAAIVPAEAAQVAHQQASAEADVEEDEEEDAWGFEEGSSASEPDRAELALSTPSQQPPASEEPASAPQSSPTRHTTFTNSTETSHPPLPTTLSVEPKSKSTPRSNDLQVDQAEFTSSPPSPSGWGEDFSDPESTGVPASASYRRLAAQNSTNRAASSARSISADSQASGGAEAKLPDPTPAVAAVVKEDCTISQRSVDLVNLAESTMSAVLSRLQGGHATDDETDSDEVEALAGTIFKIFELHRALMPVAHGEALRDVPALAMQFFNDCEYLARELSRLVADVGGDIATAWPSHDAEAAKRWKAKEMIKLEQEAALTRGLGQRWFEAQMTAQTKILLDTLMEADGFARTFDDHRYARCEKCIKQVVQTLQQLAKAWRPVLVASRFHAAIGRLVELVFQKVLHDVLDLDDIGESESEKIASLVKALGSLESLFAAEGADQPSVAPLWVPSWFKTSYLIEILTGSLVDIEFLAFEAGALVDYSRKELTGLIKALFADTPNRAKLLRRIETAPVEALAH